MKPGKTIIFLLVLAGFLAGCGQKGPLYREVPAENVDAADQASDSRQDRNEEADDQ